MNKAYPFKDARKWGQFSFLDILEVNKVSYNYDGVDLSFPNKESEDRASRLWWHLTGTKDIGAV